MQRLKLNSLVVKLERQASIKGNQKSTLAVLNTLEELSFLRVTGAYLPEIIGAKCPF